ncbi:MAG TPA: tRNA (adenosine(37)-N6)-threonylcarbamoyltransferase complex transferase subunit TsaD [Burkholderiales bacterium]
MLILGLETSCDETGVALYDTAALGEGRVHADGLLAHAVHSQVEMHAEYGGVVPELASRDHIRRLVPLTRRVLAQAGRSVSGIDAVAYTEGPGLAGALLVAAAFAHGLGLARDRPVIGIHHLEGHLLSPLLGRPAPAFPFIALLVSGGHTQLMRVEAVGRYALLGETLDDAAGEAFDKTAQLLGLGYPGGPALSKLAESGTPGRFVLPRPMLKSESLDFSFSGLKTAVMLKVREAAETAGDATFRADLARGFEDAVVEVLTAKCLRALRTCGLNRLVVAGGVGANRPLRTALDAAAARQGCSVHYPAPELCTDNGAMIAYAAARRLANPAATEPHAFSVRPRWDLAALQAPARP